MGPQNALEKFPSQCRHASYYTYNTVWETSLPVLAGKLQTHFCNPFWAPIKKNIFVGCSQRLTRKDFTTMSWICDMLQVVC